MIAGKNVALYDRNDVYLVRSLVINNENSVNIESSLRELCGGRLSKTIEYYGTPSTIVVDNSNVIIASQTIDKEASSLLKPVKDEIVDFETFHLTRQKILAAHKKKTSIAWTGCPSLDYGYTNRAKMHGFAGNTCLTMLFWLTSFKSTDCIKAITHGSFCKKMEKIKTLCFDRYYQCHGTFSDFHTTQKEFVTNFDDAFNAINKERDAIIEYNKTNNTMLFQRYNELLTYFYPWDLIGVEIGCSHPAIINTLFVKLKKKRKKFIDAYNKLLDDRVEMKNFLIGFEKFAHTRLDKVVDISIDFNEDFDKSPKYILAKFFMECECSFIANFTPLNLDIAISVIRVIIELLQQPLVVFEYTLNDNLTFSMISKGAPKDDEIITRESMFWFFDQFQSLTDSISNKKDLIVLSNVQPKNMMKEKDIIILARELTLKSFQTIEDNYFNEVNKEIYDVSVWLQDQIDKQLAEMLNDLNHQLVIEIFKSKVQRLQYLLTIMKSIKVSPAEKLNMRKVKYIFKVIGAFKR